MRKSQGKDREEKKAMRKSQGKERKEKKERSSFE
jgi:hypothetical protein